MIFSPLDELGPALAAPVRAFLANDAAVTVARVRLPAEGAVAAFRAGPRVLLLVDERLPVEQLAALELLDDGAGGDLTRACSA